MTTQLLVAAPAEAALASAAVEAGLLARVAQVVVPGDAEVEAVAAGLGHDDVELLVGSSALRRGQALARRWRGAPVVLLAAGASAYGPTPRALQGGFGRRVEQVLHLDLVPDLRPLLLTERGPVTRAVPPSRVRAAVRAWPGPGPGAVPDPTTLVLGRSAAWAGTFEHDQQTDLLVAMVRRCAEAGHSRIALLLDADPTSRTRRHLERAALEVRADLTLVEDDRPVEAWYGLEGVRLVVGCATEDLLVARQVFGHRVAQLDSEVVLRRLDPYADPRRTGATLVATTVPDLRSWTSSPGGEDARPVDLAGLMTTVAHAMQPELAPGRRADAIDWLRTHPQTRRRYVRRRRLTELRLPGGKRKVRARLG